jgi:N-acetylmuramoyl-L-alanine amidase
MRKTSDPSGKMRWIERGGWIALAIAVLAVFGAAAAIAANTGGRPEAHAQAAARPAAPAGPAAVLHIGVVAEAGGTAARLVFDRRPTEPRIFALAAPNPRLVVDVSAARFRLGGEAGARPGAGMVRSVRYAHNAPGSARIVFDLGAPGRPGQARWRVEQMGRRHILEIPVEAGAPSAAPIVMASAPAAAPAAARPRGAKPVIVIDAGHGGRDPGAIGPTGVYEKTVALASARELQRLLLATGRYEVVMTRADDTFLPLEERVRRARAARADLFVSLHADSGQSPELEGATVYTLSEAGERRARSMMDAQDWVIAASDQPRAGEVNDILVDLAQRETNNQSALFARGLLGELAPVGPLLRNSHREAAFFVLLAPDVPAVLLEMGFLTNAEDERRLKDAGFRSRQMRAVRNAINAYFDQRGSLQARG